MALLNSSADQCSSATRRENALFSPQMVIAIYASARRTLMGFFTPHSTSRRGEYIRSNNVHESCWNRVSVSIVLFYVSVLGSPIQGQTEAVLVSNWSQSVSATSLVDDERLQTFTTGTDAGGYVLTRIELDFVLHVSVDSFTVNLWTARGNRPGNRIAILETTGVVVGTPTEFTPSSAVVLEPNTEYFLHIAMKNPDDVVILKATKSGAEDRSLASNAWQIADSSIHIPDFGSTTWLFEESVLKIRIYGFARLLAE